MAVIKRFVVRMLIPLFWCLERIVPERNQLVFFSYPDVADNAWAVFFAAIDDKRLDRYGFTWLASDPIRARTALRTRLSTRHSSRVRVLRKNSVSALWCCLRASRIVFTHGHYKFMRRTGGAKLINVWHGMPIKKIGLLDGKDAIDTPASDITFASSELFRLPMAKSFGIPESDVHLIAQPRCDTLGAPNAAVRRAIEGMFPTRPQSIVVWMPTYKASSIGDVRNDGSGSRDEYEMEFKSRIEILERVLADSRIGVVVKLHPMDFLNNVALECSDRVAILRADDPIFFRSGVYELLAVSDGLITDVSSVLIDYLSTPKPIMVVKSDVERYRRGMNVEFSKFEELIHYVDDFCASSNFFSDVQNAVATRRSAFWIEGDQTASATIVQKFLVDAPVSAKGKRCTRQM